MALTKQSLAVSFTLKHSGTPFRRLLSLVSPFLFFYHSSRSREAGLFLLMFIQHFSERPTQKALFPLNLIHPIHLRHLSAIVHYATLQSPTPRLTEHWMSLSLYLHRGERDGGGTEEI
jgi:hypothetical protein